MVLKMGKINGTRATSGFLDFNTKEEAAHFMLAFDGEYVDSIGPSVLEAS